MINYGSPAAWEYSGEYGEVRFSVELDGRDILCRVSREAIEDAYGPCPNDDARLSRARQHFDQLTDLVGDKISSGCFEPDETILLGTRDLRPARPG
ncbi:MAG: DUF1488 domain-containing protein [Gammaproteobacteria bacterium]|nr:DUF1488 domain-containing protein [Gammaproteobacteria bacterium]NIR96963.1 DUF1488 domain-containing protein [Gammaproteobacteria bacterium]NIT62665.1 DUF1488 domain-containing protein [Gammaproteobacteria bacterium]NIV19625.1 DUF1488 family protein [Gammaproteobacteria bacterium]NIX10845.1 DUF1488 family protein [Gammaproteobacteria bacterium]